MQEPAAHREADQEWKGEGSHQDEKSPEASGLSRPCEDAHLEQQPADREKRQLPDTACDGYAIGGKRCRPRDAAARPREKRDDAGTVCRDCQWRPAELTNRDRKQWFRGELVGMTTSARPMTDAFAQLDLFIVPASVVIVRRESRDLESFCRKEHQSGTEY